VVYGQIIATGTPAEIRASAQVKEAYLGQHAEAAA
jgi:branched-chain amino acid transport system ATP-binding protein